MYIIKIMTDFLHSPIWYCDRRGFEFAEEIEEFNDFYKDKELNKAAEKLGDLNDSFYHFNTNNQGCYYDKEAEKANKELILQLLSTIKSRINVLNKGRFIIEDYCTEYYENL
jgi:hypothetical protein